MFYATMQSRYDYSVHNTKSKAKIMLFFTSSSTDDGVGERRKLKPIPINRLCVLSARAAKIIDSNEFIVHLSSWLFYTANACVLRFFLYLENNKQFMVYKF